MLWIGPRLSALERLSLRSFLAHGHPVRLFTYGDVEGIPEGVDHHDGREILPAGSVFTYAEGFGKGSYAAFSNLFRYKLLLDHGGIWSDTDVVCLKPFEFPEYAIAVEHNPPEVAGGQPSVRFTNCVLKVPRNSRIMLECYAVADAADKSALRWGDIGPRLLTERVQRHRLERFAMPAAAVCPLDWWNLQAVVTAPLPPLPNSYAVHMWNEMWRASGLDKDAAYPADCAYEQLKRRYSVA